MKSIKKIILWVSLVLLCITGGAFYYKSSTAIASKDIITSTVNYWQVFSNIGLERTYMEEADYYYRIPVFPNDVLALSGKEIILKGYFLPYAKSDSVIIISRYPNASCFYCGQAGIESVVMVELNKTAPSYRTDQRLQVTGKLWLNATDIKKLAFVITDATVEKL